MSMDAEIARIFETLYELLDRYEMSRAPLQQYFADNLVRINRAGYTWEEFERGRRELEADLKKEGDLQPELFRLFEQLCTQYVLCDSAERAAIRARVADRKNLGCLIRSYADHLATQIQHVQDTPKLRLALAAVSIENCSSDYRDTLTTLADLYVRAEEVGIEPRRLFESGSEFATDSHTAGACESLARMLRDFGTYAVVTERRRMGRPYHQA